MRRLGGGARRLFSEAAGSDVERRAAGEPRLVESDTLAESSYRPPEDRQAFLKTLPLPKFHVPSRSYQRRQETRRVRTMLRTPLNAPKPHWFDGLTQAKLYDSVLRYTEQQLLDLRLYKEEDIRPHPQDKEGAVLAQHLSMRVEQPRFAALQPDDARLAELERQLPPGLVHVIEELQTAKPALLPHPALATHGESVARSAVACQLVMMFPRLHSAHIQSAVETKLCLPNLVEAAIRVGLARGMGLSREVSLYKRIETYHRGIARLARKKAQFEAEIKAGRYTKNLATVDHWLRSYRKRLQQLPMREEHQQLLEERMKLLARHLMGALALAAVTKGEKFVRAFVLRFLMPDVLKQYYSSDPEMRSWLEVGHRWSFTPYESSRLPRPTANNAHVPMVINGVETHSEVVSPTVEAMLYSPNAMKELELVVTHDPVAKAMLGGRRLRYKQLFQSHVGFEGEKTVRVGVLSGDTVLGEGEGADYERAAANAAQRTLHAYFMNPRTNWAAPPPADDSEPVPADGADAEAGPLEQLRDAAMGDAERPFPAPRSSKRRRRRRLVQYTRRREQAGAVT